MFEVPPIISGMGKATNVNFGRYIQRVHANQNQVKIWEKMERGRIQGLPKFLSTPYDLRKGQSYELQIWQVYSQGPSEQKPFKIFAENGRIHKLPKFFEYPLLSQQRVKLRTSNFLRTFLVSIGTKIHYKFLQK